MDQRIAIDTARLLGLEIYNPSEPCPRGHLSPRNAATDECAECKSWAHRIGHANRGPRKAAQDAGQGTYMPFVKCINGHMAFRSTKSNACLECEGTSARTSSLTLRQMAIAFGLTAYQPLEPCKHGHISRRSASYGYCYKCNDLANKRKLAEYKALRKQIAAAHKD